MSTPVALVQSFSDRSAVRNVYGPFADEPAARAAETALRRAGIDGDLFEVFPLERLPELAGVGPAPWAVDLVPGNTLVLATDGRLSDYEVDTVAEQIQHLHPGVKVMVLPPDMQVAGVIKDAP